MKYLGSAGFHVFTDVATLDKNSMTFPSLETYLSNSMKFLASMTCTNPEETALALLTLTSSEMLPLLISQYFWHKMKIPWLFQALKCLHQIYPMKFQFPVGTLKDLPWVCWLWCPQRCSHFWCAPGQLPLMPCRNQTHHHQRTLQSENVSCTPNWPSWKILWSILVHIAAKLLFDSSFKKQSILIKAVTKWLFDSSWKICGETQTGSKWSVNQSNI